MLTSGSFGQRAQVKPRDCIITKQVGGDVAIVNLYYRSHGKMCPARRGPCTDAFAEDLKAMHVIPRTPSPAPVEQREPEQLSAAEVRELQERVRRLEVSRPVPPHVEPR